MKNDTKLCCRVTRTNHKSISAVVATSMPIKSPPPKTHVRSSSLSTSLSSSLNSSSSSKTTVSASNYDVVVGSSSCAKIGNNKRIWQRDGGEVSVCGEDAYFISNVSEFIAMGVADGVGGWNAFNVDPSLFSFELMKNAHDASESLVSPTPLAILQDAYESIVQDMGVQAGGSTACIATVEKSTGLLHVANLGDSGLLVLRPNPFTCIFSTIATSHYFNAPFQLSVVPRNWPESRKASHMADRPEDSSSDSFLLHHGDIVLIASDGLFDNLFVQDIVDLTNSYFDVCGKLSLCSSTTVQNSPENLLGLDYSMIQLRMNEFAEMLVREAFVLSKSDRVSPFEQEAQKHAAWLNNFNGGKPDDITLLAALYLPPLE